MVTGGGGASRDRHRAFSPGTKKLLLTIEGVAASAIVTRRSGMGLGDGS
jgi:hypothetical protein